MLQIIALTQFVFLALGSTGRDRFAEGVRVSNWVDDGLSSAIVVPDAEQRLALAHSDFLERTTAMLR